MRGVGSQLTRYCVEIEKVDLSDVQRTPSGPPFIPQNQTFSDYLSCNGGGDNHHGPGHYGPSPPPADPLAWQNYTCICDNGIDRQFAHQTAAQIKQICGSSSAESLGGEEKAEGGFPGMDCNCSASSLAASAKYAGFMPFVLPVYATTPLSCAQMLVQARDLVQGWLLISRWLRNAGSTPGTRRPRHPRLRWPTAAGTTSPRARSAQTTGRRSGRTAAPGAETRERARPSFSVPLANRRPPQLPEVVWAAVARHMLYGPGLLAAGWNNSDASPTPNSRIEGNAAAARKAMDALTTRCCGC